MPTNEFDLSVRPEYVSNRLAIPFNELNAMASQHQKEYDNAEESAYKFKDLMASVKAIHDPSLGLSNIEAKDALYSNYAPRIEAISNEIAKGTNIGEANRKLSQLQREWVNDPIRVELENSYANYAKYVEDKTKKGSKYDPLLDDSAGQQLIGEKGELKPFRFSGMDESLDVPKRFKEIMGDITQDVKSWDVESLGTDGIKIGNKGKRAGVDETKVNKVVDNKISLALNTDEGRQFVKKLKKINPNISEKEILNETRKQLFSSAYEQIGSEKMDGNTVDPTIIWSARNKANDDKYNDDSTPINPWNVLTGQGTPEKGALNNILASINSGFEFNSNGELEEKTSLESSYAKQNGKVSIYKDKATGQTWDINNLPKGWKLVTRPGELDDIIQNENGERINLTNKAYNNEFNHTYGNSPTKSYKPSSDYINQQREVLSFLKNSNQYDDKKTAQENYQSGIKLYGNAIKSGKLNSMSVPEFDAVTAKAFEDYYLPKFTENKNGNLILKDAGRTSQWSIEGIDKGTEDGLQEFNSIVAGANVVGPDLSKGGSHILLNTRDGKMVSVNLNNQTLAANFKSLSDFNKKNNEAIYLPNRAKTAKDFSEATITNKKQISTLDDMQNQMLNLTQQYSPESIQEVGATLERDRHNIDNLSLNLKKNNYQPLNTYYDKESNTIGISFINRQDPNNPDIQVVHYQPGTEPTIVSNAVFNRDIYQKLFGKIAVNMSDKSSNFTGTQLNTQKAK